ncbi:MAG: DUF3786 domain-containing protein [Clostridiales bacterium]|nr:DUF3786 domain-containing protein [Clostridiales bacterium]
MEIRDNKTEAPLRHYRALFEKLEPSEVSARTGIPFEDGNFIIDILGHKLRASWPGFELVPISESCPEALVSPYSGILILRYLIRGRRTAWKGEFMSYRELPWGDVYDDNFNGRCRIRLAYGFGHDLGSFEKAALCLGGAVFARKTGTVTADLPLPGGITVRMILHEGDEEFPPAALILFSDNVSSAWDAEDLAGLGEEIISALKECRI